MNPTNPAGGCDAGPVLDVAILEPYYGGSHALFVDTLRAHSRHRCRVVTMPARKWKWRMRGASAWFAHCTDEWLYAPSGKPIDVILCNDMMSVSDLRAVLPAGLRDLPVVCYFHENQLTYPIPDERDRDFQYGMTNIMSCLASDAVWFNSDYHCGAFFAASEKLLRLMPDCVPADLVGTMRSRALVLPPPVFVPDVARALGAVASRPRILWSHRWEYDKNPGPFFEALVRLDEEGVDFELVCLGEQFRTAPPEFASACDRLRHRLVHAGFVSDRAAYYDLIATCDIVVSTAIQENFGLAIIEGALVGCQPVVPTRLAYPEVIPSAFHDQCLYGDDDDLLDHLRSVLGGGKRLSADRRSRLIAELRGRYGHETGVSRLDAALVSAHK